MSFSYKQSRMKVLFYEVGHDDTDILGSGTNYVVVFRTKREKDALRYFGRGEMTFIRRIVRDGSQLKQEYYDVLRDSWE